MANELDIPDDLVITLDDLHSIPFANGVGYCHPGTRKLLSRYGISWHVFRTEGIRVADYKHVKDPFIMKLVRHTIARRENASGTV